MGSAPWLHEAGYRALCGLTIEYSRDAKIERLWVIDDRGLNDDWISRMEELRRRIRAAISRTNKSKGIMLIRGRLGVKRARALLAGPLNYVVADAHGDGSCRTINEVAL